MHHRSDSVMPVARVCAPTTRHLHNAPKADDLPLLPLRTTGMLSPTSKWRMPKLLGSRHKCRTAQLLAEASRCVIGTPFRRHFPAKTAVQLPFSPGTVRTARTAAGPVRARALRAALRSRLGLDALNPPDILAAAAGALPPCYPPLGRLGASLEGGGGWHTQCVAPCSRSAQRDRRWPRPHHLSSGGKGLGSSRPVGGPGGVVTAAGRGGAFASWDGTALASSRGPDKH